jgi:GWxTD domain-containing protein
VRLRLAPWFLVSALLATPLPAAEDPVLQITDDSSRREWVFRFWKKFDHDPATPENEYELEFHRRVQYADSAFSTETSGRWTSGAPSGRCYGIGVFQKDARELLALQKATRLLRLGS